MEQSNLVKELEYMQKDFDQHLDASSTQDTNPGHWYRHAVNSPFEPAGTLLFLELRS